MTQLIYNCTTHEASASYPLSSIDITVNADADADARCGSALRAQCERVLTVSNDGIHRLRSDRFSLLICVLLIKLMPFTSSTNYQTVKISSNKIKLSN